MPAPYWESLPQSQKDGVENDIRNAHAEAIAIRAEYGAQRVDIKIKGEFAASSYLTCPLLELDEVSLKHFIRGDEIFCVTGEYALESNRGNDYTVYY